MIATTKSISGRGALLRAVRDYLADKFGWGDEELDILPEGRPHPMAAGRFVSVWSGEHRNGAQGRWGVLDQTIGYGVTVSVRGGELAWDDWGEGVYLDESDGLEVTCEEIALALSGSAGTSVLRAANAYLKSTVALGEFLAGKPVVFSHIEGPMVKSPAWWQEQGEGMWAGLASTIVFVGARRMRKL